MAPSLLSLSILAASLVGVLAEPSDNGYIRDNDHWTPKFAATAWKASRRGSDNNGAHVFFTGSSSCTGIQFATLSAGNNHHGRAAPQNQGNNGQQQQGPNNNQNAQNNQNQPNRESQNQNQQQQQSNRNQNQSQNNQNGQVQENTFSVSAGENNRGAGNSVNNVNVNSNNFNSQTSAWTKGYCFSNSGHSSWKINTDAAFAVTSIGGSNDLADMRMFYWSTTGGGGRGNTAVLKDAYYTRNGRGKRGQSNNNNGDGGRWKSGKLSKPVSRANLGSLAATSWTKDGKVGRTVFYVQGGYLRELTLDECDEGHNGHGHGHGGDGWDDEARDGVELHFTPGEISAVSWFDDKGILHKRVYVRNTDTNQVVEYTWSDATFYTTFNNLYATSFVESGAGSSAASLQVSRGKKPDLYLWTVGPQGGAVKEDGDRHGKNAKAGTQLAAATAQGSGGASYVFFLNKDGRLTQSNRDGEGKWHEDLLVKMQNSY